MDDIVRAALQKWPNVPACHDWLALDARGDWYLRDDRTQAAGPFPQSKGSRVVHDKLRAFIERNYERDTNGAWFFQNGPQRVYVTLEAAPWVLRVQGAALHTHTGRVVQPMAVYLDEHDRLFVGTDAGLGLVHSLDMLEASEALAAGLWQGVTEPEAVTHAELIRRWEVVLHPEPAA
jgi:hypothetical protein